MKKESSAEESAAHPEAKIIDMTLVANDGKIIITNVTNDKTYGGTYKVTQKTPEGTDYEITHRWKIGICNRRYDKIRRWNGRTDFAY